MLLLPSRGKEDEFISYFEVDYLAGTDKPHLCTLSGLTPVPTSLYRSWRTDTITTGRIITRTTFFILITLQTLNHRLSINSVKIGCSTNFVQCHQTDSSILAHASMNYMTGIHQSVWHPLLVCSHSIFQIKFLPDLDRMWSQVCLNHSFSKLHVVIKISVQTHF